MNDCYYHHHKTVMKQGMYQSYSQRFTDYSTKYPKKIMIIERNAIKVIRQRKKNYKKWLINLTIVLLMMFFVKCCKGQNFFKTLKNFCFKFW